MKIKDILYALENSDSINEYYPSSEISSFDLSHDISNITVDTSVSDIQDIRNDIKKDLDEIETIIDALNNDVSELEGMQKGLEDLDEKLEEFIQEKETQVTIEISIIADSYDEAITAAIKAVNESYGK